MKVAPLRRVTLQTQFKFILWNVTGIGTKNIKVGDHILNPENPLRDLDEAHCHELSKFLRKSNYSYPRQIVKLDPYRALNSEVST